MSALDDIASIDPFRGGQLSDCSEVLMTAQGCRWPVGTVVEIGRRARAECVGFRGSATLLAPLVDCRGLMARMPVVAIADAETGVAVPFGRCIDAMGNAVDDSGPMRVAARAVPSPVTLDRRAPVRAPLEAGVRAIDGLLTLGLGQRVAIAAPAGVGKTTLLHDLVAKTRVDAIVVALIGERGREVGSFRATVNSSGASTRTVIVAATSDEAPALRLRAAIRAHDIADVLRGEGAQVLLVVDSLSRVAQAQRQIGLALGEPAGIAAYPPSAFAVIPRLVERAGCDSRTGGSVTAVYTVLAEGGDVDDPIVDAVRAATDGHIVLSRELAEQGVFPAIDIASSLSRTMGDVVDPGHVADANVIRRDWALAAEYREMQMFGGIAVGQNAAVEAALARRSVILDFVRQPRGVSTDFEEARRDLARIALS